MWRPETPEAVKPGQKDGRFKLPIGYRFRDDGLYWGDPNDPKKPELKLARCFDIVAETRDGEGLSWGILLEWRDHDGRDHRYALPKGMLAGDGSEARKALLDGGLFVAPGRKARSQFNSLLLQIRSPTVPEQLKGSAGTDRRSPRHPQPPAEMMAAYPTLTPRLSQ